MILPLLLVGLCCNLLSFLVLRRDKSMKHTTRFLLQMLAFADSMFLLIYPAYDLMLSKKWLPTECSISYARVCTDCLAPIVHAASVWMVVIVTTERYVAVCWSRLAARNIAAHITMFRVRIAVGVVWISLFIMNIPICIKMGALKRDSSCFLTHTDLIHVTRENLLWYDFIFKLFIVFLLPLSLLLLFNFCIIRAIRRSSDVTRQLTSCVVTDRRQTSSIERRCTWMMIAVITVFIVCQLPQALYAYFVNLALHDFYPKIQYGLLDERLMFLRLNIRSTKVI